MLCVYILVNKNDKETSLFLVFDDTGIFLLFSIDSVDPLSLNDPRPETGCAY